MNVSRFNLKVGEPIVGFGLTWIGLLNFVVFQWLFIRLKYSYRISDNKITNFDIMGPVVPLTGWWSPYIWAWKNAGGAR